MKLNQVKKGLKCHQITLILKKISTPKEGPSPPTTSPHPRWVVTLPRIVPPPLPPRLGNPASAPG